MKVLIIEDEKELSDTISNYLMEAGYTCEQSSCLDQAVDKISVYEYDILLLDIGLPDGSGLKLIDVIKKIRTKTGIIIISAKDSLDDKITALDMGADDYLTKPFQLSELNSRIKAVLRRRHFDGSNLVRFNEITVDTESKSASVHQHPLLLTMKEYDLLLFFLTNKNRLLTKETIAEHLWGDHIDMADNFDFIYTHINNLRKKIVAKKGSDYIKTIYGMGYKFTAT